MCLGLEYQAASGCLWELGASGGLFSAGQTRDTEKIAFGFICGFGIRVALFFRLGLCPCYFLFVLLSLFGLLCLLVPLLLSHLCFSCCHSVPPLSGPATLSCGFWAWFASSPTAHRLRAGRGQMGAGQVLGTHPSHPESLSHLLGTGSG